jgi:hypothetical protein
MVGRVERDGAVREFAEASCPQAEARQAQNVAPVISHTFTPRELLS